VGLLCLSAPPEKPNFLDPPEETIDYLVPDDFYILLSGDDSEDVSFLPPDALNVLKFFYACLTPAD
jgi:hypothetical protein